MDRRPTAARVAVLAAAGVVLVYLLALRTGAGRDADDTLLSAVWMYPPALPEDLMELVVHTADPAPFAVACAITLWFAWRRRGIARALRLAVLLIGANATTQVLQPLLAQVREHPAEIAVAAWPSGHATAAATLAIAALPLIASRGLRGVVIAWAVGVVAGVQLLGWHYPSDALGGILVAVTWAGLVFAVGPGLERRRSPATEPAVAQA